MKGLKDALANIAGSLLTTAQVKELRHPLHDLLELINTTPADMIQLKFEQKEDGRKDFHISIPGRAEQAKQKAMQQALQNGSQPVAQSPGSVEQMMEQPSSNVSQMPSGQEEPMAAAAGKKIEIRVAMTEQDEADNIKAAFPGSFLKAMDL